MGKLMFMLAALLLAALLVLTAAGCEQEPPDIDAADLIGRWTRLSAEGTETYVFFEDMTFTCSTYSDGSPVNYKGKYSVSGNTLSLDYKETGVHAEHVVTFKKEKTKMVWGKATGLYEFMKE